MCSSLVVCGCDVDALWPAGLVIVGGACAFFRLLGGLAGFRWLGDVVSIFLEPFFLVMEFNASVLCVAASFVFLECSALGTRRLIPQVSLAPFWGWAVRRGMPQAGGGCLSTSDVETALCALALS